MTIDPELDDRERSALDVWEPMTPSVGFADRVLATRGRRWLPYVATAVACGAAAAIIAAILSNPGQTLPDASTVALASADGHEIDAAAVAPIYPDAAPPIDYEMTPLPDASAAPWYDGRLPDPDGVARLYDAGGFWVDGSYIPNPLSENQYDVDVEAGETFVVHAPADTAYIKLHSSCGLVSAQIDRDPKFTTHDNNFHHEGLGNTGAVVEAELGTWHYRVYCGLSTMLPKTGQFTVLRDDGSQRLPLIPPAAKTIDPDGRVWKISYQTTIPDFEIKRVPGGERFHLLDSKGNDRTIFIKDPTVTTVSVPGSSLHDGNYTFWFERGGVRVGLGTTLSIAFDQTVTQLWIDAPAPGAPAKAPIEVRVNSTDPSWTIVVDGKPLSSQTTNSTGTRLSATTIGIPANHAVAIKASHPQRGIHYYIRRLAP